MDSKRRIAPYILAPFTLRHHACTLAAIPAGRLREQSQGRSDKGHMADVTEAARSASSASLRFTPSRPSYRINPGKNRTSTPAPITHIRPPETTEARNPNRLATNPASALPRYGPVM